MASGVKQGVVVVHIHIRQFLRAGERFLGMGVLLETMGGFRQCILSFTVGVDGWLPTLGRGNGDVCAGIPENVIGGGELFQPKTGLVAGISHLIVRGENHQYFHVTCPF